MKNEFIHRVSRGSRFNQIYIPQEMKEVFEVGDTVKVELVEKKSEINLSKDIRLGEFKEKLIKDVFSFLGKFEIRQVFFVGSFITQKIDYRDIDLLIVSDSNNESEIYDKLIEKFNLKFHIMLIPEERFMKLTEICPLTRSMLSSYASNKKFKLPKSRLDKNHIKFLLMMPEDLLKIKSGSRVFYDNIRRLIAIERFLDGKEVNSEGINEELKKLLGNLFEHARNDEEASKEMIKKLREIIKNKLNKINKKL